MPEFLHLVSRQEALRLLLNRMVCEPEPEEVDVSQALGRVTFTPLAAPQALPAFDRSTVDGYAVIAEDTHAASESLPVYLSLIGEILMGEMAEISLSKGQCALIHTGGMLPPGADAVVMVEHTQPARPGEVEVLRAVSRGENVILKGEDIAAGQEAIPKGVRLHPAEIGGVMGMGITRVSVSKPPRVGIISSGDEIISPSQMPGPGQVRDVNSYTLAALVTQAGGVSVLHEIAPDRSEVLESLAKKALQDCQALVITAGSSASTRDITAEVINRLGKPGVLVHGVNLRPGKPTILALCDGKPVIGLPGNPVSALVIGLLFVVPVIEALLGLTHPGVRPQVFARLKTNLPSQVGREDWVPVRLSSQGEGYTAEPIFYKSNLIFTLVRAEGLLRVPPEVSGLQAGELAEVFLF
ncbi:MAG: gephyrin-like molybdotransferase Glp [Chloroflexota bacterium]